MSLVRLLAAGKSLVGLNEPTECYRMTNLRAWPKFGSGRNPFREERKVERSPAPGGAPSQAAPKRGPENAGAITSSQQGLTGTLPARLSPAAATSQDRDKSVGPKVQSDPEVLRFGTPRNRQQTTALPGVPVKGSSPSVLVAGARGWFNRWTSRLLGWTRRRAARPVRPMVPRFGKGPVQVELSLDRLRVVRNDLSDADLEVVPARRTTPPGANVKGRVPERGTAGLLRASQS